MTQQIEVKLPDRSYWILIGSGLLTSLDVCKSLPDASKALIVTNDVVGPLFGLKLGELLGRRYEQTMVLSLPDGEDHKNWQSLSRIHDLLLHNAFDRRSIVYALGGGVVGDLVGFAAATYMRGINYVQVPTTLLAQVDSSVGGKTGINHPLGKNMIGAFHQPRLVLCDTDTLSTLPGRELSAGLAEVIKYGPIADLAFLDWIERNMGALRAGDSIALSIAVRRSCEIKAAVVAADERESGRRAILNFGHTFGHAIEAGLGYGRWLHGEAVGCGMLMAARLSQRMGLIEPEFVARLVELVSSAGLPVTAPDLGVDRYFELMRVDKKAASGEIRFVIIKGPGDAVLGTAPLEIVAEVLRESCAGYRALVTR